MPEMDVKMSGFCSFSERATGSGDRNVQNHDNYGKGLKSKPRILNLPDCEIAHSKTNDTGISSVKIT